MSDVNASIKVSIDSSQALSELKSLQRQISLFHTNIAKSSAQAALAQRTLQTDLLNAINATGRFSAEMRTIKTSTEAFTNSLEKNKFSIRQYFRYAGGATKTFGKLFRNEFDTISQVAEDRVKRMQTQYIKMGRDAKGAMQAMAITPKQLNMDDYATKMQLTAQKQQLFNQLLKQGSTNLLNFGKNTQWAGRQLMVGFTLPLTLLGSTAAKSFMDMEAAAIKFRKVYGDLLTPAEETQQALDSIKGLANEYTKYGIAASSTVALAADAAAAGFKGLDLQAQTTQATRLSVLGQIEQQKALETTISLQNAFQISSENLAEAINFLNSVENQTVLSLDDVTTAIPIAAPIVKSLGGDVKDLAFFMTAMKEGGIDAAEGANALKSGLASIINPTKKASDMLAAVGINIRGIVEKNKGDLQATVIGIAEALNTLRPLDRARAIEQLFGKFQFSRISTLFANIVNEGTQASRVLDLTQMSMEDLATTADKELGITADSAMNKFKKTVEDLKVSLIPVGQAFLEAVTPILETLNNILSGFKDMSSGSKKAITLLITIIGGLGPVLLMTFGLLANGLANILKLFAMLRGGYLKLGGQTNVLGEQTQYLTSEQLEAAAVASSLDQSHARLTQRFTVEKIAVDQLRDAYIQATGAALRFAVNNPGLMSTPKKYAEGISIVPGTGNKDSVPAMLMPGEAVIPTKMAKKYAPLINGMIADNIPGYVKGRTGTEGTNVKIPGGFAAAHFGGSHSMGGNDLLRMLEGRTDKVAQSLRAMVESMENADGPLTVFTNEVVAMSSDLNEAVGKTGSGKKVSTEFAKEELTSIKKSQVRDIELQRQLEAAGVPIEEIRSINKKLTDEIITGFNDLGEITEITAEDIDNLISTAYKKVAETDKRVDSALNKMKEVTTVTDPNSLTRRPITKESYKEFRKNKKTTGTSPYYQGMERMVGVGNVPFNKEAAFRITNAMGAELGMSTKEAKIIYDQFSNETKLRLSALKNDLKAFTAEFTTEAAKVASRVGTTAVGAVAEGAGTASASKKTIKVGEDISRGLEVGMTNREDDVALVGSRVANTAVNKIKSETNKLLTYGTTGPISAIDKSIRRNREKRLKDLSSNMTVSAGALAAYGGFDSGKQQNDSIKQNTKNLQGMNNALMSGTFALTSLAAVGSMTGGKLGDLSQGVMKYSGILFALMTVTQLLTQAKITELAATRLSIARSASANAMAAGPMFGGTSKSIFGKAGFLGTLARGGLMVAKFLGPIGIATTVVTGLVAGFNLYKKSQEEATRKLQAFANAAVASKKQLEASDKYFGVKSRKSNLERDVVSAASDNPKARSAVDTFKQSDEFKDYADAVKSTRELSMASARTSLLIRGQDLIGKGYSKEDASTIVNAIAEAAGKSELVIDFSKIKINDLNKQIREGISPEIAKLTKWTGQELSKGIFANKEYLADLNNSGQTIRSYFNSLNLLTENGLMSGSEALKAYRGTLYRVSSATKDARIQSGLFNIILKDMNNPLAMAAAGTEDLAKKAKLLEVAVIGAVIPAGLMNKFLYGFAFESDMALREIDDTINKYIKIKDKLFKESQNAGEELTSGDENALQALIRKTKEIQSQTRAFKELRIAGVDAATAEEMAANVDLVKILQGTKYLGDNWKNAVSAIKEYAKQQKQLEKVIAVGAGVGEYQQYLFKRAEAFISLQEQLIDMQYKTQLKNIDTEVKELNVQLDSIKEQEDLINDKFDKQINALTTIKTLNENIANQEKQRLTIADALSRGDISAAAVAIQEARSQQASASMEAAQQGLTTGKENAIASLGAKKIQQQIDALNKQKNVIEDTIEKQKESIKYFGMTADQIRDAARALDLANDAGMDINNETFLNNLISGAKGDASALKVVMISLQDEARKLFDELNKLRSTFLTTTAPASGGGSYYSNLSNKLVGTPGYEGMSAKQIEAERRRESGNRYMYGGIIKKYAAGGIVSGKGMIDKVPALLTPGEYVVNKNASRKFGPLLKSINESKYPGSMSTVGASSVLGISSNAVNNNSTSVYNYSLNIDASGGSANPNDIARIVMTQIKNMDAQRIKGNRY